MDKYGFGISLDYIKAHQNKDSERKAKNCKKRKEGETFGSELIRGAESFNELFGDEFYELAVK
jgi:hypothetical protein